MNAGLKTLIPGVAAVLVAAFVVLASPAAGDSADFATWQAESYAAVNGLPTGDWQVSADGLSVTQTADSQPTVFFSPFDARNTIVEGVMRVNAADDDFFGFVIGFEAGDSGDPNADFLLVDWKAATQTFDFGDPSCTAGTTASVGMAISHVFGVPTADELWGHTNGDAACSDMNNGVQELGRAPVLGNMGWTANNNYFFRVETQMDRVRVYVNNSLQIDRAGTVPPGGFGFYAFSQSGVTFSGVEVTQVATPTPTPSPTPSPTPTPEPATPTPEPATPTPEPAPEECLADVDGDGTVTAKDIAAVAQAQPSEPGDRRWNEAADVNGDGTVNVDDLHLVLDVRANGGCS